MHYHYRITLCVHIYTIPLCNSGREKLSAYHSDRTQRNYKCRIHKICKLYGPYFKRTVAIPNRFSGDLHDIRTGNIFQRWNRKFFFQGEKITSFVDFSYQYLFKDYLHVAKIIIMLQCLSRHLHICARTQSQVISGSTLFRRT